MSADEIRPASTVAAIRQGENGIETLLLCRSEKLNFIGGTWVFPGGAVDAADSKAGEPVDSEAAARRAAVRETKEEAGIDVAEDDLQCIAHWTGPKESPRRYATWFYLATVATRNSVEVDGGEITRHKWMTPEQAIAARDAGDIQFLPPTYITLEWLKPFDTIEQAQAHFQDREPVRFNPKIIMDADGGGAYSLYEGDAAYRSGDLNAPGPRHRFRMGKDAWHYEKSEQ